MVMMEVKRMERMARKRMERMERMARESMERMARKRMERMERMERERMERGRMDMMLEQEKFRKEMMSEQEKLMMVKLFQLAHHGKWKNAVNHLQTYPELLSKPLTATNESVLHMAIMVGHKTLVTMLLLVLKSENANTRIVRDILTRKNHEGVTPIHLAVTLGMDETCLQMAMLCPDLVTQVRNKDGETLLVKAVREGKKETFFALELLVQNAWPNPPPEKMERDVTHCRRSDGNNILHIAIDGGYLDLAYEIFCLYPILVNYVNEKGESPLHYLANMPSSFKSGTSFNLFDQVIYSCIVIGPIKTKFNKYKSDKLRARASDDPILPETCNTISRIITFMKPIFGDASIITKCSKKGQAKNDEENPSGGQQESFEEEKKQLPFPKFYEVGVALFKIVMKILLVILGIGLKTQTLKKMKRKQNHAYQLMSELVECSQVWEYEKKDGMDPHISRPNSGSHAYPNEPPLDESSSSNSIITTSNYSPYADASDTEVQWYMFKIFQMLKKEKTIYEPKEEETNKPDKSTPVLVAAKNGITEMVEKILETFSMAVLDLDKDDKNIVLLAVEYRQMQMYEFLNENEIMNDSVFRKVDKNGNSALHLAAKLSMQNLPWDLGGAALQMQWDVKWYKFVAKNHQFFATWNFDGKTAQEIFSEEHKDLLKDVDKWMQNTSQSFSVVATLIATVAFASAITIPGGTNQESGLPILSNEFPFKVFTVSSFIAFCFSVASLLTFLNIITSPHRAEDFEKSLPGKFLLGFTSLFTAIVAMLVAFSAGNLLAMEKKPRNIALVIYAITCILVLIFALMEFPIYVYLFKATIKKSPTKVAQTILNTF